jgi:hypothetical protein
LTKAKNGSQVIKPGTLVVYGDVGQAFMRGNDTWLDSLAKSFMAGNPHNGRGFVWGKVCTAYRRRLSIEKCRP